MKSFKRNLSQVLLFAIALSACGNDEVKAPVTLPPPPAAETLSLDVQKTGGNHTLVFPGTTLNISCTPDNSASVIVWSSDDPDISFANQNGTATTATINGTTARELALTCSDTVSSLEAISPPVYVNLPLEEKYRVNPMVEGQVGRFPLSGSTPSESCLGESLDTLGANAAWPDSSDGPDTFTICYAVYPLIDQDGSTIEVVAQMAYWHQDEPGTPIIFTTVRPHALYGDIVLEKGRTYTFPDTQSFDNGRISLGGTYSHNGETFKTAISIEKLDATISTFNSRIGTTRYDNCIEYAELIAYTRQSGEEVRSIERFVCKNKNFDSYGIVND